MSLTVNFVERRDASSPSIERVFRTVSRELVSSGITTSFSKARFGDGVVSILANLLFFRPPSADIFHITGHINYMGLVLSRDRTVLTIHDLTILEYRKGLRRWLIAKLNYTWPARRLRYVTAISEETKRNLQRLTGLPDEAIRVIENPLAVSIASRSREFDSDEPILLQFGTAPYKNLERLIEALAGISCRLRIVGLPTPSLRSRLDELKINYVVDESLTDSEVERALANADVVTLCSTYEGFGMPIIEAQAKGVVVVTSDRSPMREVAGGGARLVDPEDIESIRTGILSVINDQVLRDEIRRKGRANVSRFAPEKIADQYRMLYEEMSTR